jgi:capsid protein
MLTQQQTGIFEKALSAVAALSAPILYGANGKPLKPSPAYSYQRTAAKRQGSMKNWIPRRLLGRQQEALERERIVERSIDLINNDPHAAGVVEGFAQTVVGSGLVPQPLI